MAFGGRPEAISKTMEPKAQMSTSVPYDVDWSKSSGAIQCGVPMKVDRLSNLVSMTPATPKSPSWTLPASVTKMLAHLMSRWMMPWRCTQYMASATSRRMGDDPLLLQPAPGPSAS